MQMDHAVQCSAIDRCTVESTCPVYREGHLGINPNSGLVLHPSSSSKDDQLTKWAPTESIGIKWNRRCISRNTMQVLMIFNQGLMTLTACTAPALHESPITDRLKDSCSQNKGITCTHIGLSHKIDQWGSMEDGTSLQITNSVVQHCS